MIFFYVIIIEWLMWIGGSSRIVDALSPRKERKQLYKTSSLPLSLHSIISFHKLSLSSSLCFFGCKCFSLLLIIFISTLFTYTTKRSDLISSHHPNYQISDLSLTLLVLHFNTYYISFITLSICVSFVLFLVDFFNRSCPDLNFFLFF